MKLTKKLLLVLAVILVTILSVLPTINMANTTGLTLTVTGEVKDRTFELYKWFDLTADGKNYTWDTATANFFANYDTDTTKDGVQGLKTVYEATEYLKGLEANNSQKLFELAEEYYKTAGATKVATQTVTGKTLEFSGLVPGYYVVYDVTNTTAEGFARSATIISQLTENKEVELKAETVDVIKTTTITTANVGDKVPYTVTSKVPNMIGYTTYTFNIVDTLSKGLTFNNDVKVMIGDTEYTDITVTPVRNNDGTTIATVQFNNFISQKDNKDAAIVVTYSATLNSEAAVEKVNDNTVHIVYSNDPTTDSTGTTVPAEVEVYTYEINFTKKNSKNEPLEGAEFVLKVGDKLATFDKNGVFAGFVASETDIKPEDAEKGITTVLKSDVNGLIKVSGLKEGDYILKETKAPNNYTLPNFDFNFTIKHNEVEGVVTGTFDYTSTGSAEGYVSDNVSANNFVFNVDVLNAKDTFLPSTGGVGTTIFTVVGISLMVVAAVVLVIRNKKQD